MSRAPAARRDAPPGNALEDAPEPDRQFVTALARGLDILACFGPARPELGGTEIAALTGLPQPTVWRLCHTMTRLGHLVPVGGDKLRPGIPMLRLGRAALAGMPLAAAARDGMQAIADRFGSASGLAARDGGRMVFVQRCMSEAQLVMNLRVGARLPLVTSAVGWGLLAGFDRAGRDPLLARYALPDPRWPEVAPAFARAMAEHAGTGVVLNLGVLHRGYNSAAAPVLGADGKPAFAVSCAGSAVTHTPARLRREIAPALVRLAAELQRQLQQDGTARRTRQGKDMPRR